MNYRHGFHAGNFADVFKHVLLGQLLGALQRKAKPFLYLDTHAGRGRYDLAQAAADRAPEWPDGIGRLWDRSDLPPAVARYVAAVHDFNRHCGVGADTLRFYPGSPCLAAQWLRFGDRIAACETQPGERAALERELAGVRCASVHPLDGYIAPRAMLPPPEHRALVLVDPPFEAADEFARAGAVLAEGRRRLPAGVFALWYPISERADPAGFFAGLRAGSEAPVLTAELRVGGGAGPGLPGCGLVVINPPWGFDAAIRPELAFLAGALALDAGAGFRLDWLVPESG